MSFSRLCGALAALNTGLGYVAALLVVLAAIGITTGIVIRTTTGIPTDWEIPLSVLALIAATFLSAGYTQLKRGHRIWLPLTGLPDTVAQSQAPFMAESAAECKCAGYPAVVWQRIASPMDTSAGACMIEAIS